VTITHIDSTGAKAATVGATTASVVVVNAKTITAVTDPHGLPGW
jgi:hypothetical protein